MFFELALLATVAIGGWLALDLAMAEGWRRRSLSIGFLGGFGAIWAGSELLIQHAGEPWELAFGRRALYLAVYGAIFSWLWVAVEADSPRWFRESPRRIGLLTIPLVALYSTLYLAPDGTLISLVSTAPQHGPLFPVSAGACWLLTSAGLWYYARAARELRRKNGVRAAFLCAGIGGPLVVNMLYAAGLLGTSDPTPALLGPGALMLRFAVLDTGLGLYLPLARSDIIEQLEVGVVVADIRDRVVDSNTSARRFLGNDSPEGHSLESLCESLGHSIEVRHFPLHSHVATAGSAIVLTDRSEAMEAEQRLRLSSRLESLGSLTAGIAHEINNPLAYIHTNLNVIGKTLDEIEAFKDELPASLHHLSAEAGESLSDALDGIDRISTLVMRLKGFAREPGPDPADAPIELRDCAERAISVACVGLDDSAVTIESELASKVRAPEHAVVQILVNLLLNAIQARPEGPEIHVYLRQVGDRAQVEVADRGPGLPQGDETRLFDPFFTTKASGSGLGLSISFDLAERLGGGLVAENRAGGGAVFRFDLPIEPSIAREPGTNHPRLG